MRLLSNTTCIVLCGLLLSAGCATTTRISTTPEGATVYLDGEMLGRTPLVYHERGSLPKRHRLQIEMVGYETEEFFIDRELALWYALVFGGAYGAPLFWGWWMPNRILVNLRPLGYEGYEADQAEPTEPVVPEPVAPPPPPVQETAPPPPPPPAEPEPLSPPPPAETMLDEVEDEEDDYDEELVPPPPPPPPLD